MVKAAEIDDMMDALSDLQKEKNEKEAEHRLILKTLENDYGIRGIPLARRKLATLKKERDKLRKDMEKLAYTVKGKLGME